MKHLHAVAHRVEQIDDRQVFAGAVQDVTAREATEDTSNRARAELAHVARAMTLGALTTSIAHEVNQPLSGVVTDAGAVPCACWPRIRPTSRAFRATVRRALRDRKPGRRGCTSGCAALFARQRPATEPVDLNEASREVLTLSSSGLHRPSCLILRPGLEEALPSSRRRSSPASAGDPDLVLNAADAMKTVDDRPRGVQGPVELPAGNPDLVRLQYAIPVWASTHRICRGCSTPSTRPRATAWASGCPWPVRSSKATTVAFGPPARRWSRGDVFRFRFLADPNRHPFLQIVFNSAGPGGIENANVAPGPSFDTAHRRPRWLLDDRSAYGESNSHAMAFGRVEGFEQLVGTVRFQPHAGIPHAEAHATVIIPFRSDHQVSRTILDTAHRVGGIQQQVQYDLLQLDAIARHPRQIVSEFRPQDNRRSVQLIARQRNHFPRRLVQIHPLRRPRFFGRRARAVAR